MPADLHLHTTASDGCAAGARRVEQAASLGLQAIAITDHNAISAIPGARLAAGRWGVEVIAGVELDSDLQGVLTHIVGLFLDLERPDFQREMLAAQDAWRGWIRAGMAELTRDTGIALAWEDLCFTGDVPTGGDVLAALHRKGHQGLPVSWGDPGTPQVPLPLAAREVCELIHRAGGVAILAHPWKHLAGGTLAEPREFQPVLATGVDGWECWRHGHTPEQTEYLLRWVRHFGLLPSGGSDYHGPKQPGEPLPPFGVTMVPDEAVEALRERAEGYQRR